MLTLQAYLPLSVHPAFISPKQHIK